MQVRLYAAYANAGLPDPIVSDSQPPSFPAARSAPQPRNQSVQLVNHPVIDSAQPLVSFSSQQRHSSLVLPQSP